MRKLIVCNIVSLDGYYEGPGNNVMALPFDEGVNAAWVPGYTDPPGAVGCRKGAG